ncbi:leucine-rich repeat domain-containing protein [Streptomyces odonnellii]|uniref:hypothetical protein n=1 Tax=Streptomyces odonnellii TaxID=1417980 RepID=UPI0018E2BD64|nr:hypothetical protein [Streptomyces odonnellii]
MNLDPAVSQAITRVVGHEPPFSTEEYRGVEDLHIRRARDLSNLARCESLAILVLVACDPVESNQLSGIPHLRSLTIRDSGLNSLEGLTDLSLLSLYAPRNFIRDITPLMSIARLRNLDLTGNPLSSKSYRQLIPQLSEKGCRVIFSDEFEWSLTRRLHDAGVPVTCYRSSHEYRLCRPGIKLTEFPEYAHPVIQLSDAESLFTGDPRKALEYFEDEELIPFS